jgi:hypothetical protein
MGRLTRARPRTELKSVSRQPEERRMMIRDRMVREVGCRSLSMTNEATNDGAEGDDRKQIMQHDMHGNDLISSARRYILVNYCTLGHHWDHSTR